MPRRGARDSEVHAYHFIKNELRVLGWDVRNPERADGGQVWTQNESLHNPALKESLGNDKPENIVKVANSILWVFEAKRSHEDLDKALTEAEGYAREFKGNGTYQVRFITGVAGNDIDLFLVRTRYFDGTDFVPVTLNGVEATGLLSQATLQTILETGCPDIADPEIDEQLFISKAEHINEILHLGAVNPHHRAGVMVALLLARVSDTGPNIDERRPDILIRDINSRVHSILRDQGKPEFADYINIALPSTPDNHVKLRQALVDTLQELNNLNIRSAMNSGADWLGAFYEVFLKYASWAQDLGIVLTPRHLTRWAADTLDVQVNDIVYDPTCGTGGFLVAAFDYVKQQTTSEQLGRFKQHGVFGVEQDDGVAALAVVNMIFRGDGKNNIQEGNCFAKHLTSHSDKGTPTAKYATSPRGSEAVTKVMMNPPFALKRSDEKEYRFIDQALSQMAHGGALFAILPYSVMVKPGAYATWRKRSLLPNHTLLSVITFPHDVFYPVGVTTVGVFIRKGIPHPREQNVLWARALTDGLLKRKGKRLPHPRTTNDLESIHSVIKAFIRDPAFPVETIDQFQRATPLDFTDERMELVPEVYLTQPRPTENIIREALQESVRNSFAYLVKVNRARLARMWATCLSNLLFQSKSRIGSSSQPRIYSRLSEGIFILSPTLTQATKSPYQELAQTTGLSDFMNHPHGLRSGQLGRLPFLRLREMLLPSLFLLSQPTMLSCLHRKPGLAGSHQPH
jgi:type I restriction-modification system DNA methylase subunit